jgi:hypothetical protein
MATIKERVDKHGREIAAIKKLLHTGMKMLVENEKQIRELRRSQKETDRQQKETDRQLQLLIRSLNRGNGNGHTHHPVH